jgi:hypothetical protein
MIEVDDVSSLDALANFQRTLLKAVVRKLSTSVESPIAEESSPVRCLHVV